MIHATDEVVTEFAIEPYAADAPLHVVALRTPAAKYATYSHWPDGTISTLSGGQERELYDYRTHSGRLELHNSAGESPQEAELAQTLERGRPPRAAPPAARASERRAGARLCRLLLHGRARRRQRRNRFANASLNASSGERTPRGPSPGEPLTPQPVIACDSPMTAPEASSACTAT